MAGSLEDLDKLPINKYEAVIITSKYARILNKKLRAINEEEEEVEETKPSITDGKITSLALRELKEGRLQFKKPDSNRDSGSN